MNKRPEQKTPFVFTLAEDDKPSGNPLSATKTADQYAPDWERSLERLRANKRPNQPVTTENIITNSVFQRPEVPRIKPQEFSRQNSIVEKQQNTGAFKNPSRVTAKENKPLGAAKTVLDPVQREHAYQAYLQQWQQQINQEAKQREAVLNDSAVLLQEDWMAAQNCLQTASAEGNITCTVQLQRNKPALVLTDENNAANPESATGKSTASEQHDQNSPPIHVHLHVIEPRGSAGRAVTCLSEQALVQKLTEKLRPHLADVLAGMVRVAVQRHTASMIASLQKELLAEVPNAVDDILQHHMARIMKQIKQDQRIE